MTETNIIKKDELETTFPEMIPIEHNVALVEEEWNVDMNNSQERLKILKDLATAGRLVQVINASKMYDKVTSVASSSLPTTTNDFDLGDIDDWLESSKTTFYDINVGFVSDVYLEWEIRYPAAQPIGGSKETPSVRLTQDDSPYFNPKLNFITFEDDWIPSFKIFNQDGSTPRFAKIKAIGWKYKFVKVKPANVTANMPVHWKILPEVKIS